MTKRLSDAFSISSVSETHTADSSDWLSRISVLLALLLSRTYLNCYQADFCTWASAGWESGGADLSGKCQQDEQLPGRGGPSLGPEVPESLSHLRHAGM